MTTISTNPNKNPNIFNDIPILDSFMGGFIALIIGFNNSITSSKIRSSYIQFLAWFFVITTLAYAIVSATVIGLVLLLFLIVLGPVFGPIIFVTCLVTCTTILILLKLIFGYFPSTLFVGSYIGILRPFFTATQFSYLLSTLLIPMGCCEFMLEGIDISLLKQQQQQNVNVNNNNNPIRETFTKPSFFDTIWLFGCNFIFTILLKSIIWMITLGQFKSIIDPAVSSFILGSQLVSVYSVRIQKKSFITQHLIWCFQNTTRLIGFSLPLYLLQNSIKYANLVSFLWLGLTYSAAAQLVLPMVENDIMSSSSSQQQQQQQGNKKQS